MVEFVKGTRPPILPGLPGGRPLANPEPWPFARPPVGFGSFRAALLCGTSLGFTRAV